jgi:hypothetical protein
VDSDADDVSGMNGRGVKLFEGLVHDDGISEFGGGCTRQNEEPAWSDDSGAKGKITRIYEVYCQMKLLSGRPDKRLQMRLVTAMGKKLEWLAEVGR